MVILNYSYDPRVMFPEEVTCSGACTARELLERLCSKRTDLTIDLLLQICILVFDSESYSPELRVEHTKTLYVLPRPIAG